MNRNVSQVTNHNTTGGNTHTHAFYAKTQVHEAQSQQRWLDDYATWFCSCGKGGRAKSMVAASRAVNDHQTDTQTKAKP